jgi:hypothetical protein
VDLDLECAGLDLEVREGAGADAGNSGLMCLMLFSSCWPRLRCTFLVESTIGPGSPRYAAVDAVVDALKVSSFSVSLSLSVSFLMVVSATERELMLSPSRSSFVCCSMMEADENWEDLRR